MAIKSSVAQFHKRGGGHWGSICSRTGPLRRVGFVGVRGTPNSPPVFALRAPIIRFIVFRRCCRTTTCRSYFSPLNKFNKFLFLLLRARGVRFARTLLLGGNPNNSGPSFCIRNTVLSTNLAPLSAAILQQHMIRPYSYGLPPTRLCF